MACNYVRFAFLTIACLLASRGVSQENASGYSRYGTPSASQPYGQGSYGYAPSPRHEPSSAYPQTMTQSPPYQGATWQGEPIVEFPSTSSSAPMRTPSRGDRRPIIRCRWRQTQTCHTLRSSHLVSQRLATAKRPTQYTTALTVRLRRHSSPPPQLKVGRNSRRWATARVACMHRGWVKRQKHLSPCLPNLTMATHSRVV